MTTDTVFANDVLSLILKGDAIANIADNASVSPYTEFYLSLHTADPGAGGDQSTSEATYTGYARVAITRGAAFWDVVNNIATTLSDIDFGEATAGTETLTYAAIGTDASGVGKKLYSGALSVSIPVSVGTIPRAKAGSTIDFT